MNLSRVVSRLFLLAALCLGAAVTAQDRRDALVLGDSIAFSYIASVGYDYFYTNPENFIGFADDLGRRFHLDVVNGACPGETTGSFLSSTAPDYGCRAFRGLYPLHADYKSTQLDFATSYLKNHREVRLVTITLGANDGFLLEASCASNPTPVLVAECIEAGAPAVLAAVAEHIATILADLRATGYAGAIVVTNYYSLDYSDAAGTALTGDLNAAIAAPASAYGAVVADLFTAFKTVASKAAFGGKTCNTGLLNPDVYAPYVCNDHPAQTGHRLIAKTIADALRTADLD
ncbi:MAG: SGNH/GDSL hydrolase family protein [Steroidobacteraceae bacterium]|jgi:lysophospholipase L1-like esterase